MCVRLEANERISHTNWEFYSQYAVTHLHNLWYFEYRTHLRVMLWFFLFSLLSIQFERRKKRSSLIAVLYILFYYCYLPICAVVFISIYLYEEMKKIHSGAQETGKCCYVEHSRCRDQVIIGVFFFYSFVSLFVLLLANSGHFALDQRTWDHACMHSCA